MAAILPPPPPTWAVYRVGSPDLTWSNERRCPHCGLRLLTGERAGFCCGKDGSHLGEVDPLPPLPPEWDMFINEPRFSHHSRSLNLLFSLAALESSAGFPSNAGPPGMFAIQGRVYHRVRPDHRNSAVRWILYDGFMPANVPFPEIAARIPAQWVTVVRETLLQVNPFVRNLHMLHQIPRHMPEARVVLDGAAPANEIAAVITYDNTVLTNLRARRLVVTRMDTNEYNIPTPSRLWEPLAYPLLFPAGTLGWGILGDVHDINPDVPARRGAGQGADVATTQMWYYRARLLREPRFQIFGRLAGEYAVDMFTRDLESRMAYIERNQRRVLQLDAELMGVEYLPEQDNIYLPASFLGSNRWASEQIANSLAIAAQYGAPTFFITMTCNVRWPEITSELRPGQNWTDVPVVVARVFKQKLSRFLAELRTMLPNARGVQYLIHSVEFQKRGAPHAHILIKYTALCNTPEDIDTIISAEMPADAEDAALVREFMMHNHPPPHRPAATYCQRETPGGGRRCRFDYPKPLQESTTIDHSGRVHYRRRRPGDEMVVAHCLPLLRKFRCHINFEAASSSQLFQYIFKYIHKGPDTARYQIAPGGEQEPINEIDDYWAGRYLSASEAVWRILGFHITHKDPAVTALPVHLPEFQHRHRRYARRAQDDAGTLSKLERYFRRPLGTFVSAQGAVTAFDTLTYTQYHSLFRVEGTNARNARRPRVFAEAAYGPRAVPMDVIQRLPNHPHVTRMHSARPSEGERFYLRLLLQHVPARSFDELRVVDGTVHDTYQAAALARGLLEDDTEGDLALLEAVAELRTPHQLRLLFVHLLVNDLLPAPRLTWDTLEHHFTLDHVLRHRNIHDAGVAAALHEIEHYLDEYGKTLAQYDLPEPEDVADELEAELARWADDNEVIAARADRAARALNEEQRRIFDQVVGAVERHEPLCLFIDGKAGRGKTFLVNAICDYLRARGRIVIPTATAGYAAQLYPGGRTTHSAFKVPVNANNELLLSEIEPHSGRADVIRAAAAIFWDEFPMANRAVPACVHQLLSAVMGTDAPFGAKVFVTLGDFRQTCPVVRGGSRRQIVDASVKSSPLWPAFTVCRLERPIRNAEDLEWAAHVDAVGEGEDATACLHLLQRVGSTRELMMFVFPDAVLDNPVACTRRSILAATNDMVDMYNDMLLDRIVGEVKAYSSTDSVKEVADAGIVSPDAILDYVARRRLPGLPPRTLRMKTNTVYRLLRNLSVERGLVKNTRCRVLHLGTRLITVQPLRPSGEPFAGDPVLIPRITFTHVLHSGHTVVRRQYPLAPAYATTFNSCQGLTLDRVGVDLSYPVFAHGQLYTGLSRIRRREHACVRLKDGDETCENVTYRELLV